MPTNEKSTKVAEIKQRFSGAVGVIMTDYRGLSVKQMQALRSKLRETGCEIKVYKNSLTEIAVRELALPSMGDLLEGPTAFVFAPEDSVATAKAIVDFAKEHKALEVKGGFIENGLVDAAGVKAIASLPSREELVAKLMGVLLGPVRGFMGMANAPVSAFARAVQAVADQKAAA